MKQLLVLVSLFLSFGCASIVKSNRQSVPVSGGPGEGVTKIETPDGTFDFEGGSGLVTLTRSRSDIPIKIVCPDGSRKSGFLTTHYDWVAGGLGNLFPWFWVGYLIDPWSDKAYDIARLEVGPFCEKS